MVFGKSLMVKNSDAIVLMPVLMPVLELWIFRVWLGTDLGKHNG
jgi:hypothetical protein